MKIMIKLEAVGKAVVDKASVISKEITYIKEKPWVLHWDIGKGVLRGELYPLRVTWCNSADSFKRRVKR